MTEPTRLSPRKDNAPLNTLTEGAYKFSSFNYPSNIETLSHSILFNINVQTASKDMGTRETAVVAGFTGAGGSPEQLSTTLVGSRASVETGGNLLGLTRKTRRVMRAISLYVPDTVVFEGSQNYQTPSLLNELGIGGTALATVTSSALGGAPGSGAAIGSILAASLGAAAASGVQNAFESGLRTLQQRGGIVGSAISGAAGALTDVNKINRAAQTVGFAINPIIEVLYSAPNLRNFNFDFIFAPRDEEEADLIWKIIYEFRRHSSPELIAAGTIFVPPSEFDITFLRKTDSGFVENTNIPRISTCVLQDVQVDYASSGFFATHWDGMPVQIRMRLVFKEINIITRELIDKGY